MLCASSHPSTMSQLLPVNAEGPSWYRHHRRSKRGLYQSQNDTKHRNLNRRSAENPQTRRNRHALPANLGTDDDLDHKALSHGRNSSWDLDSLNTQPSPDDYTTTLYDLYPNPDARSRSHHGLRVSARGLHSGPYQDEGGLVDPSMALMGSWCNTNQTPSFFPPSDLIDYTEKDSGLGEWHPPTPRAERLPTPDLQPLSTDFEFCTCCQNEEDRINEFWYMKSKAKMDDQVNSAMEHIARARRQAGLEAPK